LPGVCRQFGEQRRRQWPGGKERRPRRVPCLFIAGLAGEVCSQQVPAGRQVVRRGAEVPDGWVRLISVGVLDCYRGSPQAAGCPA
jgi:hypothetical protein